MDNTVITTSLTVFGTLAAAFVGGIFKESYLRFTNRAALAGAIAGELASHGEYYPLLKEQLPNLIKIAESGKFPKLPSFEKPTDPVFESCVDQIGLLGAELAQEVAYVYSGLRAFRLSMAAGYSDGALPELRSSHFRSAINTLDRIHSRGEVLLPKLKSCAQQRYVVQPLVIVSILLVFLVAPIMGFMAGATYSKSKMATDISVGEKCSNSEMVASGRTGNKQHSLQQSSRINDEVGVRH